MNDLLDENCKFCSKEWIGYVVMPDGSVPWVCEDHWDMYSRTRLR